MEPGWSRSEFLDSQLYRSRRHLRIYSDAPRKGNDMGCLGVHFALTSDEVQKLKSFSDDEDRLNFMQAELEEHYCHAQPEMSCETDKAWDAIHRALTDGRIGYTNGEPPLSHVILGGELLYSGDYYIMSLKSQEQVREIASALDKMSEDDFRVRYFLINPSDYGRPVDEEDFGYTWHWFEKLRDFYRSAAANGRFALFTADQ
ncbi:MAG: YfbM family protein [Pirellulaceae bacterium]